MRLFLLCLYLISSVTAAQNMHVLASKHSIDQITEQLLGTPYLNNPLPDKENLLQTKSFDCMTFVNTVLALSTSLPQFANDQLLRLRYHSRPPSLEGRNHFVSVDWLPWLHKHRFIKNTTEKIATQWHIPTHTREGLIDRQSWFQKQHQYTTHIPKQHTIINYIDKDILVTQSPENLAQIPSGTIIIFIIAPSKQTQQKLGTDLLVSHMGFVIQSHQKTWLVHASSQAKKVTKTSLYDYLKKRHPQKIWLGVHFEQKTEQHMIHLSNTGIAV